MEEDNLQQNNNEVCEVDKNCEEIEKQRDEYLDGWKRAKADFLNYKKEETERISQMIKFANESLLYDLIAVLDSFELGLATLEEHKEAYKGMSLVKMQMEDILKRFGLESVSASPGTKFNTVNHEAIGEIESDGEPGLIGEEIKKGFVLNGKVIRPAKVKITKQKGLNK